jgi:type IX secretion system PorP/SprF family membrane protein
LKIIKNLGLIVVLVGITSVSSLGQDTHNFTQFYFNPSLLNPSYTGVDGKVALYAGFRKQWAGIEGAPTISNFSLQSALPSGLNIGLNLANDKNGLLSTSGALLTGGYTLPITPTNFIRFGISVGAAFNKIDVGNLKFADDVLDDVQASLLSSNMQVLGNVGLSFHGSTFHAGVSVPNIFQPVYLSSESFSITKISPFESITVHASNRFYFARDKNVFEPYLIYRYHQNAPAQIEAAAVLHLQNLIWVGGSYKQDFGISALAGFKLKGQTGIGYSYTMKNTGANQLSSPSHEIQLGILLGQRHKKIPVYSFVNTDKDKKTAKELQADKKQQAVAKQKALERQRALDKQKRELIAKKSANAAKKDPVVIAKNTNSAKKDPVKDPVKKDPIKEPAKDPVITKEPEKVENHSGGPRLKQKEDFLATENTADPTKETQGNKETTSGNKETTSSNNETTPGNKETTSSNKETTSGNKETTSANKETTSTTTVPVHEQAQHEDEQDKIKRLSEHAEDPNEQHGLENEAHPHAERHEFVKRGNHVDEMELGDYIIVGAFRAKENAKHFSDGLVRLGFSISDFGYLTERNIWYVYLGETDDIDMARRERDKYRKMKMFKDCWLLTVQH